MSNSAKWPISAPRDPAGSGMLAAVVASAAAGSIAGAGAGLVWGGIGGRVAMRVAALTSDDRVRGLLSDDGFEIGRISAGTIFLLIVTTILGCLAGIGYGLARLLLRGPNWGVTVAMGVASAAMMGASLVDSEGVDFRLLGPLWLLVAMFVFIPGAWGITVVVVTERLLRPGSLLGEPPVGVGKRHGGIIGSLVVWVGLSVGTAMGVVDLVRDVSRLS